VSTAYHVSGNQILDSNNTRFIVRGQDAIEGRFAGGDTNGFGLRNYQQAQRDLDILKAQRVNLIRVLVSQYHYANGPLTPTEYMLELDNVVAWITQRGMVAEISNSYSGFSPPVVNFVGMLSSRYKNNSLVWIKPDNEPACADGSHGACWAFWQSSETTFVQAIRAAGNTQPIMINCIAWSWDCSQIAAYPLGDSSLIYGPHRYGSGTAIFDAAQAARCDILWANLASRYPIVVDEIGLYVPPASPPSWGQGFLDYATIWVLTRQGSGVIGFTHYWSDSNTMTNADGSWNTWGQIFITHYWSKV
jgi:Cellulase (glycosyl hydrolase family 5)